MKYRGLKKAVGQAQRIERVKDSRYYYTISVDFSDKRIWTDFFYSINQNKQGKYHSHPTYVLYGYERATMKNIKTALNQLVLELYHNGIFTSEEREKYIIA